MGNNQNPENKQNGEEIQNNSENEKKLTENESQNNSEVNQENGLIQKLENEKKELQDKYLRLTAEFDNFKKRNAKEKIELIQTAGKEIIVSLLDVLDDCERAEKQFEKESDINQMKEGASLVFNKFKNILLSKGLKKGKVVDVIQDGYLLNEKLIRFTKVVVGK